MLTLEAKEFIVLLHTLFSFELQMRRVPKHAPIPPEMGEAGDRMCQMLIDSLEKLDLPHSISFARHMLMGKRTVEDMSAGFTQLANSVMLELENRKFYGPLRRLEPYYEQAKLFGDEVFTNFPSANEDITEAGTCLALDRATACVMHLMRVVEAGLGVLATTLGIAKQNDWGRYLREIDQELANRMRASGARSADEQFYAEVAVTIDNMRRAWRNPTMHPDKTYTVDRTEEILQSVRSFMRHLATKLHE